jgi:hypothetical protein
LTDTLATAATAAEKAEIEGQIRDAKARKAGLEAAYDTVKGTMDELLEEEQRLKDEAAE